jgi:transposase
MAVNQWMQAARANGEAGLYTRHRTSTPRRLTDEQLHLLPDFLSHVALAKTHELDTSKADQARQPAR